MNAPIFQGTDYGEIALDACSVGSVTSAAARTIHHVEGGSLTLGDGMLLAIKTIPLKK